jgi:hypothetical protein
MIIENIGQKLLTNWLTEGPQTKFYFILSYFQHIPLELFFYAGG